MSKLLLAAALFAAAAAPARAASFESLWSGAASSFGAQLQGFKMSPVKLAQHAAPPHRAQSVTIFDVQKLYDQGVKVAKSDLDGWFAGRRFSAAGVTAQLLVGVSTLVDPAAGPLGGTVFKAASLGGAQPDGISPEYWDTLGGNQADNVALIIYDRAKDWQAVKWGQTGAQAQDDHELFEIRRTGDLLVAKYADGTYGYFFKKVH